MNAPGPALNDFQAAKATIDAAELDGRVGPDTGATVTYREGQGFELTWWFLPDPFGPPTRVRQLDENDLDVLLDKINEALADPPPTIDVCALGAFKCIVESHVQRGNNLLDHVRFGQAVEEVFGGTKTVTGHIVLGIDIAGTIHDSAGVITWEHHVVPLPPGPFRPLTISERDSLRNALQNSLADKPDAAWGEILAALEQ